MICMDRTNEIAIEIEFHDDLCRAISLGDRPGRRVPAVCAVSCFQQSPQAGAGQHFDQ